MPAIGIGAATVVTLSLLSWGQSADDRLYGRVVLTDGDVVEGYVRWDRNEANRTDFLDAIKELPPEYLAEAERLDPEVAERRRLERSLVAFGVRIMWDEDDESGPEGVPSAIRFAHIRSITAVDERTARVELNDGEFVTFRSASTDIGRSMRPLVVDGGAGRERTVRWRDLERVDFVDPPPEAPRPSASRLHGTVVARSGQAFTGYVSWDLDEILATDILDGRQAGVDHEIPFDSIREIAWESDRSARVLLASGEERVLRGTNDVDRRNRGIEVSDAGFGRAIVHWTDFESVRFTQSTMATPPVFAPSTPLRGTVHAIDGRSISGDIRWDNDETRAWETLNGWIDDVEVAIDFGAVRSILKDATGSVRVELRDGRAFVLEGDRDVDDGNAGVFVKPDGRPLRLVRWRDFSRAEFVDAPR